LNWTCGMKHDDGHELTAFLRDRDRILMAAWTLPNDGPLNDTQRRQALENFDAYRRRHDLTIADVARQVDTPRASTIRDLLKGVYREHADDHVRTLNNWVEQHARQQAVKLKGNFVETRVALDVLHVARLVRENQTMGMVVGPAGIGKTRCAQALHETYVGAVLITVGLGAHNPKGFTSALAEQLGVRGMGALKSQFTYRSQTERVIARLQGSNRLLIIDEAHKLNGDALERIREIHDATGCPVFMLATKDLQDRIARGADPDHGQLYSRVNIMWPLTKGRDCHAGGKALFTVDEIRKLYDHVPIRLSPDAARYLQDVASDLGKGSLRRCRVLLLSAARRARKRTGMDADAAVMVTADDLAYADERLRPDTDVVELVKQRRARVAEAATT